jgi:hypothetical protein
MALNNKQIAFIDEYFVNGFNGTKAYLSVYKGVTDETAQRNASKKAGPNDPTGKRGTFVMRDTGTPNNVFGWANNYLQNKIAQPPGQDWWNKYQNQF